MTETELFIMRKRKRLKLKEIASYINCSISLLSRFENLQVAMDKEKVRKYKDFILNY